MDGVAPEVLLVTTVVVVEKYFERFSLVLRTSVGKGKFQEVRDRLDFFTVKPPDLVHLGDYSAVFFGEADV